MIRTAAALVCALVLAGCATGSSSEEAFAQASAESAAAAASEAAVSSPPPTPTEAPSPTAAPESSAAAPGETATPASASTEAGGPLEGRFTGQFTEPEELTRLLEFTSADGSSGTEVTGVTNNFVEIVMEPDRMEFAASLFASVTESCGELEVAETVRFEERPARNVGKSGATMQFRVPEAASGCALVAGIYDQSGPVPIEVLWQALSADRITGSVTVLDVPGKPFSEFRLTREE
jgi:hypothetical protein